VELEVMAIAGLEVEELEVILIEAETPTKIGEVKTVVVDMAEIITAAHTELELVVVLE
jgi:hypothetical protein